MLYHHLRAASALLCSAFCAALFVAAPAKAEDLTTVFYPNQKQVQFTVKVPSAWKMIPQGEEGAEDYFEVEGPNGLELSFRIVPGGDLDKAIDDHMDYLKKNFTDVKFEETKETTINGLVAFLVPASAKDEDGKVRDLGAGWFRISDKKIGELWYNVEAGDKAGTKAAIAVLNSLAGKK